MIAYTVAARATGVITGTLYYQAPPPDTADLLTVPGWYPGWQYRIDTATLQPVERQPIQAVMSATSITLGQSATLSNLPVPCTVDVDGVMVPVADGILVLTPTTVGVYRIYIDEIAYLQKTWNLEVTA